MNKTWVTDNKEGKIEKKWYCHVLTTYDSKFIFLISFDFLQQQDKLYNPKNTSQIA